jgi:hypothetical protein
MWSKDHLHCVTFPLDTDMAASGEEIGQMTRWCMQNGFGNWSVMTRYDLKTMTFYIEDQNTAIYFKMHFCGRVD